VLVMRITGRPPLWTTLKLNGTVVRPPTIPALAKSSLEASCTVMPLRSAGVAAEMGISASSGCHRADLTWICPISSASTVVLPSANATSIDNFNERFIACSPERHLTPFMHDVAAAAANATDACHFNYMQANQQ
jgi:hypothetical protein